MICPYCHKEARWCENKERYGKNYGASYMCYWCKDCDAYVGCHKNSRKPLGTMANKELREWRIKAHGAVDWLWKSGKMPRWKLYMDMAKRYGRDVHIGESDIEMCKTIIKDYSHKGDKVV